MELYAFPVLALLFVGIFTREVVAPASKNHCDRRWLILASCLGLITILLTLAVGIVFSDAIRKHSWVNAGEHLPDSLVGGISFLLTSFFFYWWHRATHRWDALWRYFHQLHHSARRVEVLTALFAHPLDTAAAVLISALFSYVILGATPTAAAWALFFTGAFEIFLHSDIRTPQWLGYLIQRPEMHTIHHAYGHHAQNYGLPIWDLLFGTWCNPRERAQQLGFDLEKSERVTDMLLCRDVHKTS